MNCDSESGKDNPKKNMLEYIKANNSVKRAAGKGLFCHFSANEAPMIQILDIFQQPFLLADENCPKFQRWSNV